MQEKLIQKVGYVSIYEIKGKTTTKYKIDSGKTITIRRLNKTVINKNRVLKEYKTKDGAIKAAKRLVAASSLKRKRKLDKVTKSLYLVLIKEEKSKKTFVKVGITAKKYMSRRFSKEYGYEGYVVETVLRKIKSKNAAKMEKNIKVILNKKRSVHRYRPLLESFSGHTECFNYDGLQDIIKIFDAEVIKNA